jgi:hypothetical protein
MTTKQDIEKSELKEENVKLRDENKEYMKELIALRKKKPRDEDTIKFNEKRIFANDRQIEINKLQILAITKQQGKSFVIYFAK